MRFIIGALMIVAGSLIIYKVEWMVENFGRIDFFEQKLATSGGTRLGYKLIALIAIFLGVLSVTGLINGFMAWALSPMTQYYM
jgi:hypothetical protein